MDAGSRNGRVNSFAIVGYLPEPQAGFINDLRRELAPDCVARAHVTILPPRPLSCSADTAWAELRKSLEAVEPFSIELGEVKLFPVSDVIYISIGAGCRELEKLHQRLVCGPFEFCEAWGYHPHVTLAQQLDPSGVAERLRLASLRWAEFPYPRSFTIDRLTFVQNRWQDAWDDLDEYSL